MKCFKCGKDSLQYGNLLDDYFPDDNTFIAKWEGECSNCNKTFKWEEKYELTEVNLIEEED